MLFLEFGLGRVSLVSSIVVTTPHIFTIRFINHRHQILVSLYWASLASKSKIAKTRSLSISPLQSSPQQPTFTLLATFKLLNLLSMKEYMLARLHLILCVFNPLLIAKWHWLYLLIWSSSQDHGSGSNLCFVQFQVQSSSQRVVEWPLESQLHNQIYICMPSVPAGYW